MIIQPEILVTPDRPIIRFREPKDQVDISRELPRILQSQGWGCGTYFHIQFLSHDKTQLLASALYVVSREVESLHTSDANPYQPMTKTIFGRTADIVGDWWFPADETTIVPRGTIPEKIDEPTGLAATITWNPGKKMHQVKLGDKIIYESADKVLAQRVANGEIPATDAA